MNYICSNCGKTTNEDSLKKSSGLGCFLWVIGFIALCVSWPVAIIILLFAIVVSLNAKPNNICPNCKATNCVIPIDSPKGKELFEKYKPQEKELSEEEIKINEISEENRNFGKIILYLMIFFAIILCLMQLGATNPPNVP